MARKGMRPPPLLRTPAGLISVCTACPDRRERKGISPAGEDASVLEAILQYHGLKELPGILCSEIFPKPGKKAME